MRFLATTIGLSLIPMTVAASGPSVPETEVREVRDVLHGTEVVDPYRWLEGSDAPEIEGEDTALDAEVAAWTDAQNAYTRSVLDGLPGRAQLEDRFRELLEIDEITWFVLCRCISFS